MWETTMLELAPIWQPDIQQQNYRGLLEVMSRPGTLSTLRGVDEMWSSCMAVLATLLDGSVTLGDPHDLLTERDWLMLQTQSVEPEQADYLLCAGHQAPWFQPKLGTLPSPEHSATLVVAVERLVDGALSLDLSGPGIDGHRVCQLSGLDEAWLVQRESWICGFPLGVDLILVDEEQVMALPRTTRVEVV
jgi:alpha-D-ribose 1-methylphosphonate 5-triphosphate synthase subunit PhnH